MVDTVAGPAPAEVSWSERRETAGTRDLILAAATFVVLLSLILSIDLVDRIFAFTRAHEDWELDEILASIPALTLVMFWYALRRWLEARRLNLELSQVNETLKSSHARILAAEAEVRDAQRFEALGRLAGGLAHELNNMLQPTITLAQLTLKADGLPETARGNLEKIVEAGECSREIISKSLTFAGDKALEKERVVFSSCLKEVVAFARTALPRGIEVRVDIPNRPEAAVINRTELTQVVTNLMSNAARAMEGQGCLTVLLHLEAIAAQDAAIRGLAPGSYFNLLIADDGLGMPEDVRRRLFEPFYTTSEGPERIGLGLAVVHGIINEWNGKITVQSSPGAGTCFTVLVPVDGT